MIDLFRKEVTENQKNEIYGEIIIPTSLGMSLSALITIILLFFLVSFIIMGKYTRKAHLSGIVMPSSGMIKIIPKYSGYVTKLMVSEGEKINKGVPLYYISGEHYNEQGSGTLFSMTQSLKIQYSLLLYQQSLEVSDNIKQQQTTNQKITSLHQQIYSAEKRLTQAKNQENLSNSVMLRYQKLVRHNYVSDIEYQQKQIELSSVKENVENQRQILFQLRSSLDTAKDDLNHLITLGKSRKSEIERQLQSIKQQLLELTAQENFTLTSPTSGIVASILIKQGQSVHALEPVMTILPDNSQLQIELYATSQNAGFIHPGQRVSLRFSAFPYQKFGIQYGTILEISRTTLTQSDLNSISPMVWKENEGHYRIIVKPEHTFILAYGIHEPLRPGMTLEGDVNLDTRYLWEWLTEPFWSLKGSL